MFGKLTDGDTDTLSNMRDNISANINDDDQTNGSIICKQLRWGLKVDAFRKNCAPEDGFDVIMVRFLRNRYHLSCNHSFFL